MRQSNNMIITKQKRETKTKTKQTGNIYMFLVHVQLYNIHDGTELSEINILLKL